MRNPLFRNKTSPFKTFKAGLIFCLGFNSKKLKVGFGLKISQYGLIKSSSLLWAAFATTSALFRLNFRYFFSLYAMAAHSMHLLAMALPLVLILCKPINCVRMPKTGSTVLERLMRICLPLLLFNRAFTRSYSAR